MEERRWPAWQIAVLALAVVGAIISVAAAILGAGGSSPASEVADQMSATATATRPIIHTKTPTLTPTPTVTPGPTDTPTATPTSTPTPTPTPVVVITKVRALGRLETAQYVMQTVVDLEREPNNLWQQMFGTDKLLLVAAGEVVAGFDLTQLKASDIVVQGTSVTLKLPPPEILYSRVDNENTYVYQRETGFLVAPDPNLETVARRRAEQALLDWALEHQVLSKAEEFGTLYLESLLHSLGFTEVRIEVQDGG
ncbi:MAG: DUF4230 domain-containing protein [Anaerolineae bacterium]